MREPARPLRDAESIHQVIRQFPGASANAFDDAEIVFLFELQWCAVKHHRGAGAGGDDDSLGSGEDFASMAHDLSRGGPVAGIERGLAAAGLILGELDVAAGMFEHAHRGFADVVVECIAQAGSHELDGFRGGAVMNKHDG